MLCVFKKILWYNTFDDYLKVIILGRSMIICPSTNIPLNADHGLLIGIFIGALVLSTFWIWKVNGSFIH